MVEKCQFALGDSVYQVSGVLTNVDIGSSAVCLLIFYYISGTEICNCSLVWFNWSSVYFSGTKIGQNAMGCFELHRKSNLDYVTSFFLYFTYVSNHDVDQTIEQRLFNSKGFQRND